MDGLRRKAWQRRTSARDDRYDSGKFLLPGAGILAGIDIGIGNGTSTGHGYNILEFHRVCRSARAARELVAAKVGAISRSIAASSDILRARAGGKRHGK